MRIVKTEWQKVRYVIDIDENIINEIYKNATVEEVEEVLRQLKDGELDPSTTVEDAHENNVDIDWLWLDDFDWLADQKVEYEVICEMNNKTHE